MREARLEELAAIDPALYVEVKALLTEDENPHHILQTGVTYVWQTDPDALLGTQMGAYRLVRLLGQGGMGAVYLAERADGEFEQQVALKLIPLEVLTEQALARFRRERQILARMEHPQIARLFDGGTAAEQLYFTMEYIQGHTLTEYADQADLSLKERVQCILQVGEAITYAHRQQVLHLDIKPSNVMVSLEGQVKVLDFGISEESYHHPQGSERPSLYTVPYAAPEQLQQQVVGTYTDVYALGVLLFELLHGRLPFVDSVYRSREKLLAAIAAGADGSVASTQIQQDIPKDLHLILRKAMAADVVQRYQDVPALMDDLRAWLEQWPISLRQEGSYVLNRWFQRNRLLSTFAGIGLGLIISLVGFYTVRLQKERNLAVQEAAKTQQLLDVITGSFRIASPYENQGDTVSARTILVRATKEMHTQLANQPELQAQMALTLSAIYDDLNRYEQADSLVGVARAIIDSRQLADPNLLADADFRQALVYYGFGEYDSAIHAGSMALDRYEALEEVDQIGLTYQLIGDLWIDQQQYEQADSFHTLGYRHFQALYDPPHEYLANSLLALGTIHRHQQQFPAAESLYQQTLAQLNALYEAPHTEIAYCLNNLASLYYNQGKYDTALHYAFASYEQRKAIFGMRHDEPVASYSNISRIYRGMGRYQESLDIRLKALEMTRSIHQEPHPYEAYHLLFLGSLYLQLGQPQQAEQLMYEGINLVEDLQMDVQMPGRAAQYHYVLGEGLRKQGRSAAALPAYRRSLSLTQQAQNPLLSGIAYVKIGACYANLGKSDSAQIQLDHAMTAWQDSIPPRYQEAYEEVAQRLAGETSFND